MLKAVEAGAHPLKGACSEIVGKLIFVNLQIWSLFQPIHVSSKVKNIANGHLSYKQFEEIIFMLLIV